MSAPPPPPPPPRSVPGKAWGVGTTSVIVLGMLAGVGGLIASALLMINGGPIWDDWILDARGVRTRAAVTLREATYVRQRPPRHWTIAWSAQAGAGGELRGTTYTTDDTSERIEVEYDPELPARSRVVGQSANRSPEVLRVALAVTALGLPLFALGVARARRRKALYRYGSTALAEVVACAPTWMRSDGEPVLRARVRFTTARGEHEVDLTTTEALGVGARVWVIHDPARPTRAMLA